MAIPLTDDGRELQAAVAAFAAGRGPRAQARAQLDAEREAEQSWWAEFAKLGYLGAHLPEAHGGGGGGLAEVTAVVEELGRTVAPGPVLPTLLTSAVLDRCGSPASAERFLPALADGSTVGACGVGGELWSAEGKVSGDAGLVLGAGGADVLLLRCGDDMVLVEAADPGVSVAIPENVDRGRRVARVRCDEVPVGARLPGAATTATVLFRTLAAADAAGVARQCLTDAVAYAKVREQFGRAIGSFQAVKHHCADMLVEAELAAAAVWDAARAGDAADEAEFELAAAIAAAVAMPAASHNARLNIRVHGGVGFTWEHDAHLYLRRAVALEALVQPVNAARELAGRVADGERRAVRVTLSAAVERQREEVRAQVREFRELPDDERMPALVRTGFATPRWPRPWGLEASAAVQMLIAEELAAAGVAAPDYGITGWILLTLIQNGSAGQIGRWVEPGLLGEQTWCQLFSEPEAGSDAAAARTRGIKTCGGWVVTGQKIWTSGAAEAAFGLATVRTDPAAGKHAGLTAMAIDMTAPGIEVRPLKQITGAATFNEVFLTEVFVPDEDVVGAVGDGWRVARSALGNERISIGASRGRAESAGEEAVQLFDRLGRPAEHVVRMGRFLAREHAAALLNARRDERAAAGMAPGPEGNLTKLLRTERHAEAAAIQLELLGPEAAAAEPGTAGGQAAFRLLEATGRAIAGGTSEIVRNQIAERILGLPREPGLR